jgi:hypothetical protein
VDACDFTDPYGHSIKRNIAYIQLQDFISGKDVDLARGEAKIRPLRKNLD